MDHWIMRMMYLCILNINPLNHAGDPALSHARQQETQSENDCSPIKVALL